MSPDTSAAVITAAGLILVALIGFFVNRGKSGLAGKRAEQSDRPDAATVVQALAGGGDGAVTMNLAEALKALSMEVTRGRADSAAANQRIAAADTRIAGLEEGFQQVLARNEVLLRRNRDLLEWGIHAPGEPPRTPPRWADDET